MSLAFLKNHPFAVEAYFKSSLVLTYAVAAAEIKHMIPACLELDTFEDKWAFIAIAVVQTKHLRPKGFPQWLGNDFILTGYRIFVRYTNAAGKRLRGLYIIGSETDKKKMQIMGNIFTHYNYKTTDISLMEEGSIVNVQSKQSDLDIAVDVGEAVLPPDSPFHDWKEARRFAGPLPFTFTYNEQSKKVVIIEGVRTNWTPAPVHVIRSNSGFINRLGLKDIRLANAFIINNVPYYWKRGKTELWKG
jgi:uncharacterized protein YqjF (DUF2071 family)